MFSLETIQQQREFVDTSFRLELKHTNELCIYSSALWERCRYLYRQNEEAHESAERDEDLKINLFNATSS